MLSSEAGYKKLISQEFSNISQSEDSMKKFVDKIKYLE